MRSSDLETLLPDAAVQQLPPPSPQQRLCLYGQ